VELFLSQTLLTELGPVVAGHDRQLWSSQFNCDPIDFTSSNATPCLAALSVSLSMTPRASFDMKCSHDMKILTGPRCAAW
jgi:hypothetical protein